MTKTYSKCLYRLFMCDTACKIYPFETASNPKKKYTLYCTYSRQKRNLLASMRWRLFLWLNPCVLALDVGKSKLYTRIRLYEMPWQCRAQKYDINNFTRECAEFYDKMSIMFPSSKFLLLFCLPFSFFNISHSFSDPSPEKKRKKGSLSVSLKNG